jgi:hypothetical protein
MNKKFIAGGCSFTFGHELSDDNEGKTPSKQSWAYVLSQEANCCQPDNYICTARPGAGNSGIARRVFNAVANTTDIGCVVVMWSFLSRYDWAMPRHSSLEHTRWATISPWDTKMASEERHTALAGSEAQQEQWKQRDDLLINTGVKPFAEAIYKHAANEYHETYLSWKSIIWLQNILEKKKIPYMFTLADNSLFYKEFDQHKDQDPFMTALHNEIDLTKWFFFGERNMGFNQWALLNEYERGTTHPLDKAHRDAVKLMQPKFNEIIGGKNVRMD